MNIQTAASKTRETIFMTESDSLKENTLRKLVSKVINGTQAAEILRLSVRQVKRLKKRFVKKGIKGILHQNRGRASNNSVSEFQRKEITKIIKTSYPDFGPTLSCEKLSELHNIFLSTQTIRTLMIDNGLWKVKPIASEKFPHVWRARKDCFGQMQQYDGSYHNWFEGRLLDTQGQSISENCLLASIDDATGKITHAKFDDSEGVLPTMAFWQEYLRFNGKPCSIYLDRFSTYKNNQKKNTINILGLTQFQRACQQSGMIEVINAHSAQAKGRIERLFQTLQDRLVKELRLRKISTIAEANIFLTKTFIPWFNQKFAVVPKNSNDIHTRLSENELLQLPSIFSIHDNRSVMNDYTVMHQGRLYQVDPKQPALVRIGDRITVQTRLNGQIFLFKQNNELQFTEILERANKVKLPKLTDGRSFGHKPLANHPWKFKQQKTLSLTPVLAQV
jgi:transposase